MNRKKHTADVGASAVSKSNFPGKEKYTYPSQDNTDGNSTQICILREFDGTYDLTINGKPAFLLAFDGRLHWRTESGGPGELVTDLAALVALREQLGLAPFCLKHNFAAILTNAEVAA